MPEGQSPDFNCHTEIEKCHLNVWFKEDFFFFFRAQVAWYSFMHVFPYFMAQIVCMCECGGM